MGGACAGSQDAGRCAGNAAADPAGIRSRRTGTDPDTQRRLLTFVIVGGGPTGVELAGALGEIARASLRQDFRTHSSRVRAHHPARGQSEYPGHVSRAAALRCATSRSSAWESTCAPAPSSPTLIADGVVWRPTIPVEGDAGERIEAQTVLWAAGVAASPLGASLGVPLDQVGRVLAEPTLGVPGLPGVFVAGDICALTQDGRPLPGVAQVAMQEGAHAARNVLRAIAGEPPRRFAITTTEPWR